MLLNSKKCKNCGVGYDDTLSRCPHCKTANTDRATLKYKNKVAFLPIAHEFACFLVGLAGLYLFNFIFGFAAYSIHESDPIKYLAIQNFSSYACVFVCLVVILFKYFGELASHFKKARPYIAGLIYGAAIIAFSAIYLIIMDKVYPTPLSQNEINARKLTVGYPYLSIIILCFIGPICEEITYRLGLFTICSRFNRYVAYVVTIVIFALIHFGFTSDNIIAELISLPVYIVSGFLLCLGYEKEGPACSITAHILNNLYSVIGVLIVNAVGK